jgi:hypothetical protein
MVELHEVLLLQESVLILIVLVEHPSYLVVLWQTLVSSAGCDEPSTLLLVLKSIG